MQMVCRLKGASFAKLASTPPWIRSQHSDFSSAVDDGGVLRAFLVAWIDYIIQSYTEATGANPRIIPEDALVAGDGPLAHAAECRYEVLRAFGIIIGYAVFYAGFTSWPSNLDRTLFFKAYAEHTSGQYCPSATTVDGSLGNALRKLETWENRGGRRSSVVVPGMVIGHFTMLGISETAATQLVCRLSVTSEGCKSLRMELYNSTVWAPRSRGLGAFLEGIRLCGVLDRVLEIQLAQSDLESLLTDTGIPEPDGLLASLTWDYGILEMEDAPARTRRQRQTLRSLITEWIRESTPDMRRWFIKQSTGGPCLGAEKISVALVADNSESVGNIDSMKGALVVWSTCCRTAKFALALLEHNDSTLKFAELMLRHCQGSDDEFNRA